MTHLWEWKLGFKVKLDTFASPTKFTVKLIKGGKQVLKQLSVRGISDFWVELCVLLWIVDWFNPDDHLITECSETILSGKIHSVEPWRLA